MSVKSQIPTLSRLYTIYEDLPDSFLDESDIDSYFYHNILDVAEIKKALNSVQQRFQQKSICI